MRVGLVLDRTLRTKLETAVKRARRVAEAGARDAINQLAVGNHEPWSALSPEQRKLRNRLRAHGRHLGDKLDDKRGTQTVDRLTGECAYEHWHRLLFARFLAENDLLVEPASGMPLSLDECRELAREQKKDWLVLASDFAQRMLPQIFRVGDPVLEVALPPEKRQELEAILEGLQREVFIADDSLGWVYQFWQSDQKEAVNASENKIGADELPAVTQLFTEDYMVLFLLHNTVGAWWAGKMLLAKPDLARSSSEEELRAACAVQGIGWSYLRFVREGDIWRPAAGTFPGWPADAKDLTVLDPCMGSGHFLVFALPILVALRRQEEKLSVAEAVDAVLRDNLFGLELDPRCTQIAAFNVGLTAWKLAGYRPLPALNLACAGLAINAPAAAWTALAAGDPLAQNAMKQLYELFRQAPTLGSLIDPTRIGGELFVADLDKIRGLLSSALASEDSADAELAVVAQGIAKAASILAERFTLVATNVPYLARGKQNAVLQRFAEDTDAAAKADLAIPFLSRISRMLDAGGAQAVVLPQNWLFQSGYQEFRESYLRTHRLAFVAGLGPAAFQDMNWWAIRTSLIVSERSVSIEDATFAAFELREHREFEEKSILARTTELSLPKQAAQLQNPEARIILGERGDAPSLSLCAASYQGIKTGDDERLRRLFWEIPGPSDRWRYFQSTVESTRFYGGLDGLIDWTDDGAALARRQGVAAWGRRGVMVSQMSGLPVALYMGEIFDSNASPIVPRNQGDLDVLWAFCASDEYRQAVRAIDQSLKPTNTSLVQVPFDRERWSAEASMMLPKGLPPPGSNEPTQWLFTGDPRGAAHSLQVAVARLVGYRWPRQAGAMFAECDAIGDDALSSFADDDGIVCLVAVKGEQSAADRVRTLLGAAYASDWSASKLNELLAAASADGSIEEWLRDSFFAQHCELFGGRPFVWQIWDGLRNGFSALVNYHKLAAPNGEGRRTLEKLIYTYLGDWLDRQRADQKAGVEGVDGRVAAAEHLKRELEKVLEGEPPYDLFVRWKPLHQQPVGWEPSIDDGVRVNIRPFMTAKPLNARGKKVSILRVTPKIKWDKDRGKEPTRDKVAFPGSGAGTRARRTSRAATNSTATAGTTSITRVPRSSPHVNV